MKKTFPKLICWQNRDKNQMYAIEWNKFCDNCFVFHSVLPSKWENFLKIISISTFFCEQIEISVKLFAFQSWDQFNDNMS